MRILKFFLILVGLVIAGFLVLGVIGPKVTIDTSTRINKPANEVYFYFMDSKNMGNWMNSFVSFEHVGGNLHEIGAEYKLVFEDNGERMEMTEITTAIEENKKYAFDFTNDAMIGDVEINLLDANGATDLNTTTTFVGNGFIFKAILPFFKGSMKVHMEEDYNRLKQNVEAL